MKKDFINLKEGTERTDPVEDPGELTSGQKITRNSVLNIIGYCAPLLVALITVPVIIREMGTERFGFLTLAWAVIGYFSLFDFGLNRALTKLVAEKFGSGEQEQIPSLVWTSLVVMLLLGLIVAVILIIFLPWLVQHVLTVPAALQGETLIAFYMLSLSVPLVIVSVGLKGVLSAYQRFDIVNFIRIPMGIYTFLAPLLIIKWYSNALHPILAAIIFGRLIAMLVQLRLCNRIVPFLQSGVCFQRTFIHPLLSYGGWITVSNIIGPLMIYIDRFFISALISAAAVAYYATPNEAATKLWFLPWAILGVLFPAFSSSLANDPETTTDIFNNSLKYLFIILFPIVLVSITYSSEGLNIWLGSDFAGQSSVVFKWMIVGVFMHSLAQVPYALLQGAGRPDMLAKLHMFELPVYIILLWQLIQYAGTLGAAIAWTLRLSADGLAVFFFVKKVLPGSPSNINYKLTILCVALLSFFLTSSLENLFYKSGLLVVILLSFTGFVWFILFNDQERGRISKGIFHVI